MPLRNDPHGYGLVSKTLHWVTVAAFTAQFAVGLSMSSDDDVLDAEEDRIDALEDAGESDAVIDRLEDELDAREDALETSVFTDGIELPEVHVLLGLSLLALGVLRVVWRATTPLPPWAPYLGPGERRLENAVERLLLTAMFVVPASGLVLLAVGTDLVAVHVGAQLLFLAVLAGHVGLVLRHTVVRRDGQLRRMV